MGDAASKKKLAFTLWCCAMLLCPCSCDTSPPRESNSLEVVWSYGTANEDGLEYIDNVQPVIEGGMAYVARDTTLTAVDLETGEKRWAGGLGNDEQSLSATKLLADAQSLFLNETRWVRAFNKSSGELRWSHPLSGFNARGLETMAQNQDDLFLGGDGEIARLSKSTGDLEQQISVDALQPGGIVQQVRDPVSAGGYLYAPTAYHVPGNSFTEGNLLCYNAQSGAYRWGFPIPNHRVLLPGYTDSLTTDAATFGAAISGDRVVFPGGQSVFALDRFTGEKLWETFYETDGFNLGKTIAADEERAYAASVQGRVYALDLETGEQVWDVYTDGSITAYPVLHNGKVYQLDNGRGQLWVIEAATGNVIWHGYPPQHRGDDSYTYVTPPAVGEGMIVIVGSKRVYGLRAPE